MISHCLNARFGSNITLTNTSQFPSHLQREITTMGPKPKRTTVFALMIASSQVYWAMRRTTSVSCYH